MNGDERFIQNYILHCKTWRKLIHTVHGWFLFLLGFYIVDIFWLYYVFTPYTKHFIKIKVLQLRECKGVMLHSYLHITDTCLWRSLSSVYKMVIVERFDFNETQQKPLQNELQISS